MNFLTMYFQSIKAGMFIVMGCIIYLLIPEPIIGALLFSLGLLSINLTSCTLFTGQVHKLIEHTPKRKIYELINIWLGNMSGVIFTALFILFCRNYTLIEKIDALSFVKISIPYNILFFNAVICGILMTMATRKDTPKYVTIGCVWAFVYAGFNHCIADALYFFFQGDIIRLLIVTLGNFIGGLIPVIGIGSD